MHLLAFEPATGPGSGFSIPATSGQRFRAENHNPAARLSANPAWLLPCKKRL